MKFLRVAMLALLVFAAPTDPGLAQVPDGAWPPGGGATWRRPVRYPGQEAAPVPQAPPPGYYEVPAPVYTAPRKRWRPRKPSGGSTWAGYTIPDVKPLAIGPVAKPSIVIRLREQRLYLLDGKRSAASFPVSTGLRRTRTPRGTFRVAEKIRRPGWVYKGQKVRGGVSGNPLGLCWLGLGMPRGWTGAPIGMHGTNAPWVIGRPASHGCIRMRNRDAVTLFRAVPVGCMVRII